MIKLLPILGLLLGIHVITYSQTSVAPTGDGSEANPYKIATLDNLYWLSQTTSVWNKHFIQTADIDATETRAWDDTGDGVMEGFSPIGKDENTPFTGTYHGQNHVIKGLYINRPNTDYVGLFGYAEDVTIDSLGVTGGYLVGQNNVGGMVGYSFTSDFGLTTINVCYSTGIINCTNNGGGIIGYVNFYAENNCTVNITKCFSSSNINSNSNGGGIIGYSYGYSKGAGSFLSLRSCYNTGTINCVSNGGGIIGNMNVMVTGNLTINKCYNSGTLNCLNNGGGIVGYSSIVTDGTLIISGSYSSGIIHCPINRGGIVGWILAYPFTNIATNNSYWDTQTSNINRSIGVSEGEGKGSIQDKAKGKTTIEMKQQSTFIPSTSGDWDFSSTSATWQIRENQTYPALKDIDNAPFAFRDTLKGYNTSIELNKVLANDYDYETGQTRLVYQVKEVYGTGKVSNGIYSFPDKSIASFTDSLLYRVGELKAPNDTLWGNCAKLVVINEPQGTGTEADPYKIATLNDLKWLSQNTSIWSKNLYYTQTADIDASDTRAWDEDDDGVKEGFLPIGKDEKSPFTGTYHGQKHVIKNLYINRPNTDYVGLFGVALATIDSLGVVGGEITGKQAVGGLVGLNWGSITGCYNTGKVAGGTDVGGIAGMSSTQINSCYNTGTIIGSFYIGGITGYNEGKINTCYNTGKVSGSYPIGGIAGYSFASCEYIYNTGLVTGSSPSGSLIGMVPGLPVSYYFDYQTSGQSVAIGNFGDDMSSALTTAKMKQEKSFDGFKFTDTWGIRPDSTYPALKNIENAPFAFRDTIKGYFTSLPLQDLLANDYDYETLQKNLVFQITHVPYQGGTVAGKQYSFPANSAADFTDSLIYRVGELLALGDTLWGNCATAVFIVATKIAVDNTSLTLRAADGSFADVKIISDGNWNISENSDWLTLSTSSGSGDNSITVKVTENNTGVKRSATLTLSAAGATDIVVTVTQQPKTKLAISLAAQNKPYDGNTNASVAVPTPAGIAAGDIISIAVSNAHFDTKNVGTAKTVTADMALAGADAGNYTIDATATTTADITAIPLTVGINAQNKPYDGNTNANATAPVPEGIVAGDDVSVTVSNARFDTKNVGTVKTVTADMALTGADAGNYTIDATATATADITAIPLTVGITAQNKPYDGNTHATVIASVTGGFISGDEVVVKATNGQFDNADVGKDKSVTATISLEGTDSENYTYNNMATTTADILDITAPTVIFDGLSDNMLPKASIVISFSEPVNLSAPTLENVLVIREGNEGGNPVPYMAADFTSMQVSQFTVTANLQCGTAYHISIAAGAFADASGNAVAYTEASFATAGNPDKPLFAATANKLCPGSELVLSNYDNSLDYQWLTDEEELVGANGNAYVVLAGGSGNYTVTATNTQSGCQSVSDILPVTVYTAIAPVVYEKKDDMVTLLIVDNSENMFSSYKWSYADNNALPSEIPSDRQFLTLKGTNRNGEYRVETTDTDGCKTQSDVIAAVATDASANVYPTINNGSFKVAVDHPNNGIVTIKIISQTGVTVNQFRYDKAQASQTFEVNIGEINAGNYSVEVSMGSFRVTRWIAVQ